METFGIATADRYVSEYDRLSAALGVPGAKPAPGELEFLRDVTALGRFDFGMLSAPEIFFAAAVTSILGPQLAIEIGTASGSSAAILAKIIVLRQEEEAGRSGKAPVLHTIDKKAEYVFDATKPVGFAIELVAPELRDLIVVHPLQDSSHIPKLIRDHSLTFAFIDGNHRHPWPLVDLMQIQQVMQSGAWILLHDIDLPGLIERALAAGQKVDHPISSGAKYLFDYWPDKKIRSGNIGVVRLPEGHSSLGDFVEQLRALPAEVSPGSWKKRWREIDALQEQKRPRRWFFHRR